MSNIMPPTAWKGVCKFIGLVYYYQVIWERLSHTLKPFTNLSSIKINFKWTEVKQKAFEEIN